LTDWVATYEFRPDCIEVAHHGGHGGVDSFQPPSFWDTTTVVCASLNEDEPYYHVVAVEVKEVAADVLEA
jgi:hypothetical protein